MASPGLYRQPGQRWHKSPEQFTSCPTDPTDSHMLPQTPSASQMSHDNQSWESGSGTEGISAAYEG